MPVPHRRRRRRAASGRGPVPSRRRRPAWALAAASSSAIRAGFVNDPRSPYADPRRASRYLRCRAQGAPPRARARASPRPARRHRRAARVLRSPPTAGWPPSTSPTTRSWRSARRTAVESGDGVMTLKAGQRASSTRCILRANTGDRRKGCRAEPHRAALHRHAVGREGRRTGWRIPRARSPATT